MRDWWKVIEDELDAHSETAPDPWSDLAHSTVELTDAQQKYLASIEEQPPISRPVDPRALSPDG
jgi:hypothetical protein